MNILELMGPAKLVIPAIQLGISCGQPEEVVVAVHKTLLASEPPTTALNLRLFFQNVDRESLTELYMQMGHLKQPAHPLTTVELVQTIVTYIRQVSFRLSHSKT